MTPIRLDAKASSPKRTHTGSLPAIAAALLVSMALAGCVSDSNSSGSSDSSSSSIETQPNTDQGNSTGGNSGSSSNTGESQIANPDTPDEPGNGDLTRKVTLSWTAPTMRENEAPLTLSEIAGFEVHYGLRSGEYTLKASTDHASETEMVISGLEAGHWHFAVRTIDIEGRKSVFSEEKRIHIN